MMAAAKRLKLSRSTPYRLCWILNLYDFPANPASSAVILCKFSAVCILIFGHFFHAKKKKKKASSTLRDDKKMDFCTEGNALN